MVFKINMTIALSLLALASGMFLLIKVWKEEMCCKVFAKIMGYIVVIASILLFLCSSIHGVLYMTGAGCGCGKGGKWHKKGGMHKMMQKHCPKMEMMQKQEEQDE